MVASVPPISDTLRPSGAVGAPATWGRAGAPISIVPLEGPSRSRVSTAVTDTRWLWLELNSSVYRSDRVCPATAPSRLTR